MSNFKEMERFFLKKTNSERLPSLCGDIRVRFNSYAMISPLYQLLRDYNEYEVCETVFQVTLYEDHEILQCKTDFYRMMVEYYYGLWGQ